jgi:hypothetical protein
MIQNQIKLIKKKQKKMTRWRVGVVKVRSIYLRAKGTDGQRLEG